MEDVVEPPQAEPGLELRDGGEGVEELLRGAQGDVWLGRPSLHDLGPLVSCRHQIVEEFLKGEAGRRRECFIDKI